MLETIIGIKAAAWLASHKRTVAILAAITLIALASILLTRSCGQRRVELNEKEQQEVRDVIETRERDKMEAKYIELEVKNANIDANVAGNKAETVNVIANARTEVKKMTDEELAAFLESQVK